MKVERVTATIKYSQDTGKGAWKAIEIGAEATVNTKEHWPQAQAQLYAELSQQLKTLWANGHNGAEKAVEVTIEAEPSESPEHYCREHQTEYKRYARGDSVWWSHKKADGKWCREK